MQTATARPAGHGKSWAMGFLVFGLVLACYWPAVRGELVLDDAAHITRPALRSWLGLGQIWFQRGATAQYYPLLNTAFWLEHRLWGDAVMGYHLVNILLHAAAACLLVAIVRRLALPGAWLAGLIFALHPVAVESVAWISEQKNNLSAVFFLGAALVYLGFDGDRRPSRYWTASVLFLLALLTKTVTATLPPALLVVLWWRRGRLGWKRDVLPLLPWFILGAAAGLYTAWFERQLAGAQGPEFSLSLVERCLVAGRAIWFYLGSLLWPADLMFIYPRWTVNGTETWQYLFPLGVAALAAGLWLAARRTGGPRSRTAAAGLAGFLVFAGMLFPVLGFLNINWFRFAYVADHFQYLANLGLIVPLAAGFAQATSPLRQSRTAVVRGMPTVAAGLLVAGLGALTWLQSGTYRDPTTLYRATLARNPACWVAHNNLAWELARSAASVPEAVIHYEEALRLNPACAEAHDNYAGLLATLPGQTNAAIAHFEEALRLRPDFTETHANLANLLARNPGRRAEAVAQYQETLRLAPDLAEVHYSLANVLAQMPGRLPEALAQYELALRLKPDLAQAHVNLANELAKLPGRMNEALAHYAEALRIDPRLVGAHYDLAVQLSDLPGREADAQRHFEEALRLRPDYAKAHNNLAVLLARQGRLDEARRHWEQAVQLDPNYEDARRNLDLLRQRAQH